MQEINREKLMELLKERDSLGLNDDINIKKVCDKMLYCCGDNEKDIVDFISTLDLNDLMTMSEIFEDISIKLNKSKTFKEALEEITKPYPDVDFSLQYC